MDSDSDSDPLDSDSDSDSGPMDSDSDSDSGPMDSDSHLMDSDSGLMDSDSDSDSGLVDSDSLPDSRVRTHSNTGALFANRKCSSNTEKTSASISSEGLIEQVIVVARKEIGLQAVSSAVI